MAHQQNLCHPYFGARFCPAQTLLRNLPLPPPHLKAPPQLLHAQIVKYCLPTQVPRERQLVHEFHEVGFPIWSSGGTLISSLKGREGGRGGDVEQVKCPSGPSTCQKSKDDDGRMRQRTPRVTPLHCYGATLSQSWWLLGSYVRTLKKGAQILDSRARVSDGDNNVASSSSSLIQLTILFVSYLEPHFLV